MAKYTIMIIAAGHNGKETFPGTNLKVERGNDNHVVSILLEQEQYIINTGRRYDIERPNRMLKTTLTSDFYINKNDHPLDVDQRELNTRVTRYRRLIASLLYIGTMSRPDALYAINYLAKFSHDPHRVLFDQVIRVFGYLLQAKERALRYGDDKSNKRLIGYSDSDYAQEPENRLSTIGYLFRSNNANIH